MAPLSIVALEGDQTGQELLDQALRVLDPEVLGLEVEIRRIDLSLANRRATRNAVCAEAAEAMLRDRARPQGGDDHARGRRRRRQPEPDPPRSDRRQGDHAHRSPDPRGHPGRRRPSPDRGLPDGGRRRLRRRAVARGRRTTTSSPTARRRSAAPTCRAVAEYAFREAERISGRVYGGPKWTVSPIYEGMLKEEMDAAAERHPGCAIRAGADRRDARRADRRRRRRTARDPVPEPRRRPALRPRAAAVRVDRRRRVRAARARRRPRAPGGDGRGSARHRAGARGQGTSPTRWR